MGRLIIICLLFMSGGIGVANAAYVKIVSDPWSLAAWTGNTAYITGVEMSNTRAVEETEGMKRKTFAYHTAVLEAKEFHLKSMQNVAGFGQESRYYKEIYNISADIVMRCPRLIDSFKQADLSGKAYAITRISQLYSHTVQLVQDFVNIVNNGKVKNPLEVGNTDTKSDGYNLIDRDQRLEIVLTIYADLRAIRDKIWMWEYSIVMANWGDVANVIDSKIFYKAISGKNIAQEIVNKWERL